MFYQDETSQLMGLSILSIRLLYNLWNNEMKWDANVIQPPKKGS